MHHKPRGRPPSRGITEAQRRTLQEIRDLIARKRFPPTIQELAAALAVQPATVHQHVNELVRKGFLRREPHKARGLAIVREPTDEIERLVPVPLLGVVTAGLPMLAEENVLGEVLVDASVASRGRCFALRVSGDSMIDAGIHDGDIVIARQQPVAESGDIVVALLGEEATVKRLHIRGDRIELRPENRRHRPIVIGPETDLRVLGKVLAVRRCSGDE